ncbi:uncharacterized protein LOC134820953 isoform X2 [Bolinopsis microptera]|uniref:uncharacterized protein LOC134820953 isoform X2 n=1 Tax=Bolinopsis microptera TaxID=2820187 RepID=UPI0030792EF1
MEEAKIALTCCQIRKKSNATGTKSSVVGIGCLVTLPASGLVSIYQDRLCILSRYLKLPQISLARDCFVVFNKDKRIQLKPDRYLESCPKLGFTLVACEQAKVMRDDQLKPVPLIYQRLKLGDPFCSVKLSPNATYGYTKTDHKVTNLSYSNISYSVPSQTSSLKISAGGPLLSTDKGEIVGFKESDGTEAILHQLELLEQEDIGIDKNQLKMSACQALSKLAAKSVSDVECLVSHECFLSVIVSFPNESEPNVGLLGATCKLLTIITSPQTLTCQTRALSEDIVSYVLSAMSFSQHATVHLFGCRVLLNLITSHASEGLEPYDNELGDIRTIILDKDGANVLRRVVRSHRDDKHIQHTVCLILSLLLEFTYRGWRESEEHRLHCITELEQAQDLLSQAGDGLNTTYDKVEAELAMRIEEQDTTIRQKNKVIENRDSTIEQLHRRLEFAMPTTQTVDNTKLEEENLRLTETLERERDLWHCKQSELEASLEFSQELVKDMTTAIRQIKYDLENSSENLENKRVEYNSWNSIKDELDRITRAVQQLGKTAEEELIYHYDMVDVGREEDQQLQKSMESVSTTIEKDAALRRFERTHSQTSLDISMDSEQKATKTLDKLQMVRRAIHGVEQTLESEEERLEKLRQKRFINPLHDITESSTPQRTSDVDVHDIPRGLLKHMCRMLDEPPSCGWRRIVPLLGMSHRLKDIESSLDSPTAELIRIWTNENRLVTFPDLMEVLRLAEQMDTVEFIKRHLQLKKRLSKQSFLYFPIEKQSSPPAS